MTVGSLNLTVKAVGSDDGPGEFEAILSTSQQDRDGETIKAGAFHPLPQSIPVYYQHDWKSGALPVAKAAPYYDGENLMVKGTFASTARGQEMRSLVTEGIVDSMSVGFIKTKSRGSVISQGQVIEGSFTGIPINTGAKVLAAKAMADLDPMPGFVPTMKTMEGSYEDLAEDLQEALADVVPGAAWIYIRGTYPDYVVFDVCTADDMTTTTYRVDYTSTGLDTFDFANLTEVDVEEVIVSEDDDTTKSVGPPADDPAAAQAAAGSPAEEDARMQLVARSLEHIAAI